MVAQPNRRAIDGENELVTLTAIEPRFLGKNHMHPDMWVGKGELFGEPIHLLIRNTREHRDRFLKAGYVPADLFKNVEVKTNVTVLTEYDGHNLIIADVMPATDTVLPASERDAAWKLDVAMFGKPVVVGEMATFARMGDSVVWTKDEQGRYVRTWGNVKAVYEGKR